MPFSTDLEVKHGCEAAAFASQPVERQFAGRENRALAGAEQNEFRFMLEQHLEMRYRQFLQWRWSETLDQSVGRQCDCTGVALIADDDGAAGYLADRRC